MLNELPNRIKDLRSEVLNMDTNNMFGKMQLPIESSVVCLNELFGQEYVVPVYQRPYSWEENQIDDFLSTIIDGYRNNKQKIFFGTMQFNEVDRVLQIVDGQQRLTTVKLFLYVLRKLSNLSGINDINIVYKNSSDANSEVERILQKSEIDPLKKIKRGNYDISNAVSKYEANARMLYTKCIDLFETNFCFQNFYDYIIDSFYVVKLVTKDENMSLPEIVNIFNTINTTGMDLNGADIFKIQYFDYLNRRIEKNDKWMDLINESYQLIDEYNHDKPQKDHFYMADVLTVYKHCICAKYKKGYENLSKSNEKFFDEVFKNPTECKEMLAYNVFNGFVKIYIDLLSRLENNTICSGKKETWAYKLICRTRYSRYWTIPFIVVCCYWFEKKEVTDDIYNKEVKISYEILKYFVVNSTIYAKVINPVQTKMCNSILPKLASCDFEGVENELAGCIWYNPYDSSKNIKSVFTDCLIDDGLSYTKLGIELACLILAIDAEIRNSSSDALIKEIFFSDNPYDIEHTYSQNLFSNLKDGEKIKMNGLGNLVLLERNINRDMGGRGILHPEDKVNEYNKSGYHVIKEIKNDLQKWNIETVKKWGSNRIDRLFTLLE